MARFDINATTEGFGRDVQAAFGDELVSVILYGSAVTDEFVPNRSDLNFLIVLTPEGIHRIEKIHPVYAKWRKRRVAPPHCMTKPYIADSLDSFPVEFLNMKAAYRVVLGEDALGGLVIDKKDLRLACEREVKGKLILLRQGLVRTRGRKREIEWLVRESLPAIVSIFRALLTLKGKDVPATKRETVAAVCQAFGLDENLFTSLLSLRDRENRKNGMKPETLIASYIIEMDKLSEIVDRMIV
jgi:predicted nucleotidyltransferase